MSLWSVINFHFSYFVKYALYKKKAEHHNCSYFYGAYKLLTLIHIFTKFMMIGTNFRWSRVYIANNCFSSCVLKYSVTNTDGSSVNKNVTIKVLGGWILKMAVFWVVAPCSMVEVYRHFRGPFCLHHQGDGVMEAARTSETLVNFYQTTRRCNPKDSRFHTHRRQNLRADLGMDIV
jgi:hypothetical protein